MLLSAAIATDKADYSPGQTANIQGSGFAVGETVALQIAHHDGTHSTDAAHQTWFVTDGGAGDLDGTANGMIRTTWSVGTGERGAALNLTATGQTSGSVATTHFTDSSPLGSVSVSSQIQPVTYGGVGTTLFNFTVNRESGVTGAFDVDLSVAAGLPSGATYYFTVGNSTVTQLQFGASDTTLSAVLHVSTAAKTASNSYSLTVKAEVDVGGSPTGDFMTATAYLIVSQRHLTLSITAANKAYDGTTSATLTSQSLNGVVAGDDVSYAGGTANFGTKNAGTGKTVTVTGVTLTGGDAVNYVLDPVTTTANVTALALSVAADPKAKVQNQSDPALTWQVTSGSLIAGDTLSGALTRTSGEDPGNYAITKGTLSGNGNYTLTFTGSTLTVISNRLDLSGAWRTSGQLVSVDQNGTSLSFVDLGGAPSTGTFTSPKTITGLGGLIATIDVAASDSGRILWSDGTIWLRISLGGQYYNPANNGLTSVAQDGINLTFTNVAGTTVSGTITSYNTVSIPAWGQTATFNDGVLTMSGGSSWKKLDLSPDYLTASGNMAVSIRQNGTTNLVFVNRVGDTANGRWISPTTVQVDDWNVTGVVANGKITWSNGTVWKKNLQISGTTNVGGTISILATDTQIILTNRLGTTSRAKLTSADTIVALDWGVTGTIDDGKITWSNGTMWKGIDFNDLDAIFSDLTKFPFGS